MRSDSFVLLYACVCAGGAQPYFFLGEAVLRNLHNSLTRNAGDQLTFRGNGTLAPATWLGCGGDALNTPMTKLGLVLVTPQVRGALLSTP